VPCHPALGPRGGARRAWRAIPQALTTGWSACCAPLAASHAMGFRLLLFGGVWLSAVCSHWGRLEWEWRAEHLSKISEMHKGVAAHTVHSIPRATAARAASMHLGCKPWLLGCARAEGMGAQDRFVRKQLHASTAMPSHHLRTPVEANGGYAEGHSG